MVRLSDLSEADVHHLLAKPCQSFSSEPWVSPTPLTKARVALVSTAGLQVRGDRPFPMSSAEYRVIPGDISSNDLLMSHNSVNFDRSGFQQDINVVFPIDRLKELASAKEIGSVARYHYACSGAGLEADAYAPTARELATLLRGDGVDVAVMIPV